MADRTLADALWRAALDLNRAAAAVDPRVAALPPLIFMTDPARTPQPWRVAARLPAGAAVIHRSFGRAEAEDEAKRLREATLSAGVRLLIAADAALALRMEADGVHLPERDLGRAAELRELRHGWLLTGAAHPPHDGFVPDRLDAVLASPVFPAGGASGSRPAIGVAGLSAFRQSSLAPVYALGGIDAARAKLLADSGACGVAAVEAVRSAWGD